MRRWVMLLCSLLCILAATGCAVGAARAGKNADAVWQNTTLYLDTPLSVEDAQALAEQQNRQEEPVVFAAWGEQADQTVTDPGLGKSIQTAVISMVGSSEWMLPGAPVLAPDNTDGCLIGENTAWKLFGSTKVTGSAVGINGQTYRICGVVHCPADGVYVQMGTSAKNSFGQNNVRLARITLAVNDAQEGSRFLMQYGLSGKVLRMDYLRNIQTLAELVPGKWSDFEGWKANIKEWKKQLRHIVKMRKTGMEYEYAKQCKRRVVDLGAETLFVTAAVVLLSHVLWYTKTKQ